MYIHTYTQAFFLHTLASESRTTRARTIAATKSAITLVKPNLYTVKSQTGVGVYRVLLDDDKPSCSCPDAVSRGSTEFRALPCKHYLGVRFYLTAERETPRGPVTERIPLTYGQAWSAYNAAQTGEIALFDSLLADLVETIDEPFQALGRPRVPLRTGLFCAIQKVYSQLSLRRAHGLFTNAVTKKHLDDAPHFNAPSKLLNRADITPILHELIHLSSIPLAGVETDFAIDSTGFRTTSFGSYCAGKYGATKPHIFLKAHICVGTKTNVVTAARITDSEGPGVGDSLHFAPLLQKTAENGFAVERVSADKAYSGRANHDAAEKLGAQPLIPFKENASGRAHSSPAWKKAYHYFQLQRDAFETRYHKRSNVESTFSAIKRKFGETLKSRNRVAQENELLCKIIAYNITVLIHEMHEHGIDPQVLRSPAAPAMAGAAPTE